MCSEVVKGYVECDGEGKMWSMVVEARYEVRWWRGVWSVMVRGG